jgi:hypothetical protein
MFNVLFFELDKTLQALKQENAKLREEVASLRESKQKEEEVVKMEQGQQQVKEETDIKHQQEMSYKELMERMEKLENSFKAPDESKTKDTVIQELTTCVEEMKIKICELENQQKDYETKIQTIIQEQNEQTEKRIETEIIETNLDLVGEKVKQKTEETSNTKSEDILKIVKNMQAEITEDLASLKSSLTSPLSVMFDATRSEDLKGKDDFLPFDKAETNLGGGFDIETGKFTAPLSGLYFFALNVYGAPRDAVIMSIRACEFQDVGNISGVGKGSQSVVIHLDAQDTCGVWVDEKTKMIDSGSSHFTHFIGILLRPKGLDTPWKLTKMLGTQ